MTRIDDPFQSYHQFISRVIQEYEALAVIFKFIKIDAEAPIYDQHITLRRLFQKSRERPWPEWNEEAICDWARTAPQACEVVVGH